MPGAHIVLDFSMHFDTQYRHMNDSSPHRLNDDYIRTWSISTAPPTAAAAAARISTIVRRMQGGMVTAALHSLPLESPPPLKVPCRTSMCAHTCSIFFFYTRARVCAVPCVRVCVLMQVRVAVLFCQPLCLKKKHASYF